MVPSEKKKVEAYLRGLPENIKGETTSSRPVVNEAVRMAHTLKEQKLQAKAERIADSNKRNAHQSATIVGKWDTRKRTAEAGMWLLKADRQGGNVRGQAYVIRDAEHNQGPNVVTGTFLLNNRYVTILFDSGADKSFVDVRFSHLLDIKPTKLNTSYEVELADRKVVCINTVLKGCTLNLLDHLFDIDLMPIDLGTFNVIIGMDWLVERDAVIMCSKKEVHVPYKNKTLVVKGYSGASRLKLISCIKARKYIERGSELFLAQVTEKEPSKKQLQDVPMIRNFPEVFPDNLPGLPPPRQVEFRIELVPRAAPVAHAPYRLAPSELKELSDQLKELLEKGFIRPSSSPWGAPVLFVKKKDGSFLFMDLMNRVCKPYLDKFVIVFIDDILIYSKNKDEHEKHLKIILELLKKEQLYAKLSKCDFWLESVQFLGHVINNKGVHVDPAKVEAIRNWSAPTTPTKTEAMKEENVKAENLGRLIKPIFETRSDGIQYFKG
ncbi:putative reverse transcriptase domain-containing protein [Tanacetum coccineum]|uniref:Reverse transcriptase domain-containing protein n=1 Tax=Tanacetum coccineum TaxID=301880 RepID=A0ABQ5FCX9_9ASTR